MLKYDVYENLGHSAVLGRTVEFEATDHKSVSEIKDLVKSKEFWVSPADEESAYVLMQTSRRGRSNWTPEMVKMAHELRANDGSTDFQIRLALYNKFEVEVTEDSLRKTLRQETNVDVPLEEGLREKAASATPAKKTRKPRKTEEVEEVETPEVEVTEVEVEVAEATVTETEVPEVEGE